ncbi:hypothetical protein ACLOJK_034797 [Asimina triloba]
MAIWVGSLPHLSNFWVLGDFMVFAQMVELLLNRGPTVGLSRSDSEVGHLAALFASYLSIALLDQRDWRMRKLPAGRWVLNRQDLMAVDVRCWVRKGLPNKGREVVPAMDVHRVEEYDGFSSREKSCH